MCIRDRYLLPTLLFPTTFLHSPHLSPFSSSCFVSIGSFLYFLRKFPPSTLTSYSAPCSLVLRSGFPRTSLQETRLYSKLFSDRRFLFPPISYSGFSYPLLQYVPVSYTHLDVYKRQEQDRPLPQSVEKLTSFVNLLILGSFFSCERWHSNNSFLDIQTGLLHGISAVSYTHLDVYKRQVYLFTVNLFINVKCEAQNFLLVLKLLSITEIM